MNRLVVIAFVCLLSMMPKSLKAQMLSVNTDLLMDAACIPSFGAELVIGNHSTLNINGMGTYHPYGADVQFLAFQPEVRYYLSRRPMYHHFVGVCGQLGSFDMTYAGKRRNGYGAGAGITFGYTLPISSRWNFDFHAGFTTFFYEGREYDRGVNIDNYNANAPAPRNATGHYTFPARVGVSLSYIIQ